MLSLFPCRPVIREWSWKKALIAKKNMTEEKQKLETDYRNNEKVENLIQQNTKMKEQISELEDRHQINNLWFMGLKEKFGAETEKWEEYKTKVKVFLEKTGFRDWGITLERAHRIEKKEEGKRKTIIATFLNYKQGEKVLNKFRELKLWEDQIYRNKDFSEYTVEKRKILIKPSKEIRERGNFAQSYL